MKSGDAQGFGNKPFNPQGSIDTTSPNGAITFRRSRNGSNNGINDK
jgi:hypothetical protein